MNPFNPFSSIPPSMIWQLIGAFLPTLIPLVVLAILIRILDPESMRYSVRKNKFEIFTAIFAVIGFAASYYFIQQPKYSFFINVSIALAAMFVFIYLKTRDQDFYFIPLRKEKEKEDWIGEGTFQYERTLGAYKITNSHSGVIFPKCLIWSDYSFSFEFKILKSSLGVILRATNLSNLVMLQIFDSGIKPHIRINGFWRPWEPKESHLEFDTKLKLDNWYFCLLQCDKGSVRIRIFENIEHADPERPSETIIQRKPIFDRVWKIPSGTMSYEWHDSKLMKDPVTIPFPINLEYGTFGFRNHEAECALIKNVLVEKI